MIPAGFGDPSLPPFCPRSGSATAGASRHGAGAGGEQPALQPGPELFLCRDGLGGPDLQRGAADGKGAPGRGAGRQRGARGDAAPLQPPGHRRRGESPQVSRCLSADLGRRPGGEGQTGAGVQLPQTGAGRAHAARQAGGGPAEPPVRVLLPPPPHQALRVRHPRQPQRDRGSLSQFGTGLTGVPGTQVREPPAGGPGLGQAGHVLGAGDHQRPPERGRLCRPEPPGDLGGLGLAQGDPDPPLLHPEPRPAPGAAPRHRPRHALLPGLQPRLLLPVRGERQRHRPRLRPAGHTAQPALGAGAGGEGGPRAGPLRGVAVVARQLHHPGRGPRGLRLREGRPQPQLRHRRVRGRDVPQVRVQPRRELQPRGLRRLPGHLRRRRLLTPPGPPRGTPKTSQNTPSLARSLYWCLGVTKGIYKTLKKGEGDTKLGSPRVPRLRPGPPRGDVGGGGVPPLCPLPPALGPAQPLAQGGFGGPGVLVMGGGGMARV